MNTCYNCFKEYASGKFCPRCGYEAGSQEGKYPHALKPGSIVGGRYIIGKVLGQGGFGITYAAQDYNTKKMVAIKEFLPEQYATRVDHSRVAVYSAQFENEFNVHKGNFLEEAKTLSQFNGIDGICDIYSYFEENGTAYFAMEYVDGITLEKYMEGKGRLGVEETVSLLLPAMRVLDQIHAKGIIHRDISPDNIMLKSDGRVVLIDFGAARYSMGEKSRSLDVVLKHGYAPREQYARHGRQGPFTDVYSLAATFYRCVTGRKPPEAMDRDEADDLALPSTLGVKMSHGMENVLLKALAPRAGDRYQRMGEFALALTETMYSRGEARSDSEAERRRKEAESAELRRREAEAEKMRKEAAQAEARRQAEAEAERRRQQAAAEAQKRAAVNEQKQQQKSGGSGKKSGGLKKLIIAVVAIFVLCGIFAGGDGGSGDIVSKPAAARATNSPEPTPTPVKYIEALLGEWADEPVYVRGTGESSACYDLYLPVRNCKEMTLSVSFDEWSGYPFDEWYLYVRDLDGNWSHVAMFNMEDTLQPGETKNFTFSFDPAISFDALSIAHVADGYQFNVSYSIGFFDIWLK